MASNTGNQQTVQTMTPTQWLGPISVYLLIPVILLGCGGHLEWWQAWVYAFLIMVAGIGGRIWAERQHPGLLAERVNFEKAKVALIEKHKMGGDCLN
nr:hypothetical protein [FCB group bacterium]